MAPKSVAPTIRIAFVCWGHWARSICRDARRGSRATLGRIVCAVAGLLTLAVVCTPKFATDMWSYTLVGRTVAVHHMNPYRVAPAATHDPLLHLVYSSWRNVTTPYGPVLVLHAAFVALFAGSHPLLYRLAFQSTSALAIGLALWLLWRTTHSTASLALVGLHPEVAGSVVNGGHNDAVVALGLLVVVLLLTKGRVRAAGYVIAIVLLAKLTIVFAIVPIAVWIGARYGRRALWRLLAPTAVALPLLALIPGAVRSIGQANGGVVTRLAIWNVALHVRWLAIPYLRASNYTTVGLAAMAGLLVAVALRARHDPDPVRAATGGAAVWVGAAAYVLAWYTVLGLVVAALQPTRRLARWLALQGGVVTAAYLIPRAVLRTNPVIDQTVHVYIPIALTAAFVWALLEPRAHAVARRDVITIARGDHHVRGSAPASGTRRPRGARGRRGRPEWARDR